MTLPACSISSQGKRKVFAEVQVRHAEIYKYNKDSNAHWHYEYWRSQVSPPHGPFWWSPHGSPLRAPMPPLPH